MDSTTTVKEPGETFVTVKFPRLSEVAPLDALFSPFFSRVMVAYSIGRVVRESTTVPVILALASLFSLL